MINKSKIIKGFEYLTLQSTFASDLYWEHAPNLYSDFYAYKFRRHGAPIEVFKIAWVAPKGINYITGRSSALELRASFGEIKSGDWDRRGKENWEGVDPEEAMEVTFTGRLFKDTIFYKSFKNRYINGFKWKNTEFVKILLDRIAEGKTVYRDCSTEEELLMRCEDLDHLYNELKSNGYKQQSDLRKTNPTMNDPIGLIGELTNEICVDIGRNGELLFVDGKHRLAISKLLDLEKVPVVFITRHKKWMELREKIFESDKVVDHPDLVEFHS